MKKIIQTATALFVLWSFTTAGMCTKVVAYGVDSSADAVTHTYSSNTSTVLEAAQKALTTLGYQASIVDTLNNRIVTGWRPVNSDSHYLELFGRRDYAANAGSYYQLTIDVSDDNNKVKLAVFSTVKSMCGKLSSAHVVENKILARVDDLMRSPQIEMTNVGVTER